MQEIIDKIDNLNYDIACCEEHIETTKAHIAECRKEIKKLSRLKDQVEKVLYPEVI